MKFKFPKIAFRTDRGDSARVRPAGRTRKIAVVAVAAFLVAGGTTAGLIATSGPGPVQYTAYFGEAVGVYPGSNVDVLGVKVGTVTSVRPEGKQVKVVMSVDRIVTIPATADAVSIVPSVVADRYVQLSPAYTGGPALAAGGVIPRSRTATPVEIDQIYSSIAKLAGALGPNGVNSSGALSDVLNTGAANLRGNGQAFGTMIQQLSQLAKTLNGTQGDFFGTISNLQKFANMLRANNGQVQTVQGQLSQVSGFLAADRSSMAGALSRLSTALAQVQQFISGNRDALKSNVAKLKAITQVLVKERASLAQALDNEPLAADNFIAAYDPQTGSLNARGDPNELSMGNCGYISNPNQKGCPLPLPATGTATSPSPGASPSAGTNS
jgi:phospholipid/cholesterol/gamma-HCH transport system substrate-binding protein